MASDTASWARYDITGGGENIPVFKIGIFFSRLKCLSASTVDKGHNSALLCCVSVWGFEKTDLTSRDVTKQGLGRGGFLTVALKEGGSCNRITDNWLRVSRGDPHLRTRIKEKRHV